MTFHPRPKFSLWYQDTTQATAADPTRRREQMFVRIPRIVIKLEGGVGNKTVPLLVAEMAFDAELQDWSTQVSMLSPWVWTIPMGVDYPRGCGLSPWVWIIPVDVDYPRGCGLSSWVWIILVDVDPVIWGDLR